MTQTPAPVSPAWSGALADGFAWIPERFWEARVHRMLGTNPGERPLARVDDDGLPVRWLYGPEQAIADDPGGLPDQAPFVRGTRIGAPWQLRQEHGHPDPKTAGKQILEDLVGGVTAITISFDDAARHATPPADDTFLVERGVGGTAISTVDDLDRALEEVYLELAPVALDAGPAAPAAAALLLALWRRRELDLSTVQGSLGLDPVGTLAREGRLHDAPQAAIAQAARLAAEVAELTPQVQALRVDTRAYVMAGATPVQELALAAAVGTTYLRACVEAGLKLAVAASQIEFQLTAGPVQFTEIAKLRAWRRIWARILEASGVPAQQRRSPLYSRATERMLSAADPWTNLLRGTAALFAGAVGGADGATVQPFDVLRGRPSTLARRMARNTQVVLLEEAGLARVADPAGGSWYVESRTDALAQAAWAQLQRIEAAGGVLTELANGALAARLGSAADARQRELARRRKDITGVNQFPLLGDDGLAADELDANFDAAGFASADRDRRAERPPLPALRTAPAQPTLCQLAELAAAGARIDELLPLLGGEPYAALPLPERRDAASFEALRGVSGSDTSGLDQELLEVVIAPVGTQAQTVAPVTWARNWLAAGGLQAIVPEQDASAVDLLAAGRGRVAMVCGGKGVEPAELRAEVHALRAAGAALVIAAMMTAQQATELGADRGVRDGDDMLAQLAALRGFIEQEEVPA